MSDVIITQSPYPVVCYHRITNPGVQPDWAVPFHRHDGFEFYLFLGGNVIFTVEGTDYSLSRGDLFILNHTQAHRAYSVGQQQYKRFIINLRRDRMKEFLSRDPELVKYFDTQDLSEVKRVRLSAEGIDEYCAIAEKLEQSVYLRKPCDDLLVDAYLTEILVLVARELEGREQENQEKVPELVTEVKDYIFNHLTEQIALEDLSKQFFFNGKYISATFKKYTGMTLRSYILDQRISLAKRLLREGSNVSEACYHSGFLDYTNFIRSFTRAVGMPPGKYSRCARAGALEKF